MKRLVFKISGALIAMSLIVCSIFAWFIQVEDRELGLLFDGFNRELTEVPDWAFFIRDDVWAGFGWRLFDLVWFWGGLFVVFKLFSLSAVKEQLEQHQDLTFPLSPEQPGEAEMLKETIDLMGSKEYREMSDTERHAARVAVRQKYGFDSNGSHL